MYPVFYVGFICKGFVCERESVKTQGKVQSKEDFAGSSREAFPRSKACDQYITGMWRVMTDGDSWFSRVSCEEDLLMKYPRNILFCQFFISDTPYP